MSSQGKNALKGYIKFQLAQLGANNHAHIFEEIAYELARIKVCTNLLPATGPVQAGGDQGKDFETYRTFLKSNPQTENIFIGLKDGDFAAFPCTIDKNIIPKIKRDLENIFSHQIKPQAIFYFCTEDIAVAKRHKLEEECLDNYGVGIQIFDGTAISDMLCDKEVLWISSEFLDIPNNLFPNIPEEEEDYSQLKEIWLDNTRKITSFADFLEVQNGVRTATFADFAKVDIRKWIKLLKTLEDTATPKLKLKSLYEIIVAQLRGVGNLDAEKATVEEYFTLITARELDISEIKDSAVLLLYCYGGLAHAQFNIDSETLEKWTVFLENTLDERISRTTSEMELASLHEIKGFMQMMPQRLDVGSINDVMDTACNWWEKVIEFAQNNPLYPIDTFSRYLNEVLKIGSTSRVKKLIRDVDVIIGERSGNSVIATQARDRAIAFAQSGNLIDAIDELHRAKVNWFSGDTLEGSILAMLLLSDFYQKLHLHYASKYYAEGALFLVLRYADDNEKLIPKHLRRCAEMSSDAVYCAGLGMSFLYAAERVLQIHFLTAGNAFDLEKYPDIQRVIVHTAIFLAISKKFDEKLHNKALSIVEAWSNVPPEIVEDIKNLIANSPYEKKSNSELITQLDEELGTHLFKDVGSQREISWVAFGVTWKITCENTATLTCLAESLSAIIQILQVDFANIDLITLPTDVHIELSENQGNPLFEHVPNNHVLSYKVALSADSFENGFIVGIVIAVLKDISCMSEDEFIKLIEDKFREGLSARAFFVRPAPELFEQARQEKSSEFDTFKDFNILVVKQFSPLSESSLAWKDTLAPNYSQEQAQEFLKNRYATLIPMIKPFIPEIMKDERLSGAVTKMKEEGFLDWQILDIFQNSMMNKYMNKKGNNVSPKDMEKEMKTIMNNGFSGLDICPSELTTEDIEFNKKVQVAAVMKTWNPDFYQKTPNDAAIKKLLDVRYRNSIDDIEHENIFGWE